MRSGKIGKRKNRNLLVMHVNQRVNLSNIQDRKNLFERIKNDCDNRATKNVSLPSTLIVVARNKRI